MLLLSTVAASQTLAPPPQASVLHFDGDANHGNTYGTAPTTFALGPSFTMMAWVYPDSLQHGSVMGTKDGLLAAPTIMYDIELDVNTGRWMFNVWSNDATESRTIYAAAVARQWTHLAATFSAGHMVLYVNGSAVGSADFTATLAGRNVGPFSVGGIINGRINPPGYITPPPVPGVIRQASVWSRVLSAQEIAQYATAYMTGSEPGLQAYWPMDDGPLTAHDLTGHAFDLTFGFSPGYAERPKQEPSSYVTNPYFTFSSVDLGSVQGAIGCELDANGDGFPDVVLNYNVGPSWPPFPMHAAVNDGKGNFSLGDQAIFGTANLQTQFVRNCVVGDFDGDGKEDLFLATTGPDTGVDPPGEQSRLLMRRGNGLIDETATRLPNEVVYTHGVAAGDVNRDGALNLFMARCCQVAEGTGIRRPVFYINDGHGNFTADYGRYPANTPQNIMNGVFLDANRDGYPDLLVLDGLYPAYSSPAPTAVLLNDGTGHFTLKPNAVPPWPGRATWGSSLARAADFDGDGNPDVILQVNPSLNGGPSGAGGPGCGMELLLGNGDGTFRDATDRLPDLELPAGAGGCYRDISVADMNGDGYPDIYSSGSDLGIPAVLFINTGDGHFVNASAALAAHPWVSQGLTGDLNRDGKNDLFLVRYGTQYWTGSQVRPFVVPPAITVPKITTLTPTFAAVGRKGATVTISGSSFALGATALWNGATRPTEFIDQNTVAMALTATDLASAGVGMVTVQNVGTTSSNGSGFAVLAANSVVPQTGWWWDPKLNGTGFFMEASGKSANGMFVAGFLYDGSGNATWLVSTGQMTGPTYTSNWLKATGGQTLLGPYKAPSLTSAGNLSITFTDATHGVLTRPDGTNINLQRFSFTASPTPAPPVAGAPQAGWWWAGSALSGSGYGIEIQGNGVFIVAYVYDDAGNPVWYLATGTLTTPTSYTGSWDVYAGGPQLTSPEGTYTAHKVSSATPMSLTFTDATHGTLTMGNVTIPIVRFQEF